MVERVALWNSKWQYEPNPPRPVKPYEMNEFNQANGTPVDIVIATSTTEEENNTTTKESASSHNVDDHNGCDGSLSVFFEECTTGSSININLCSQ